MGLLSILVLVMGEAQSIASRRAQLALSADIEIIGDHRQQHSNEAFWVKDRSGLTHSIVFHGVFLP